MNKTRQKAALALGYLLIVLGFFLGLGPVLDGRKLTAILLMATGLGIAARVLVERQSNG